MPIQHNNDRPIPCPMNLALNLPPCQLKVVMILIAAQYSDEDQISIKSLCDRVAVSRNTLRENIKELESLGVITKTLNFHGDGGSAANSYSINWEKKI